MSFEIFVWMHLPGDLEPVLAGRASVQAGDANPRIGTFVYSRNYLQLASALPVDPIALPLEAREFETAMLRGCHAALLDAGPDAWGRSIIELRHGAATVGNDPPHAQADHRRPGRAVVTYQRSVCRAGLRLLHGAGGAGCRSGPLNGAIRLGIMLAQVRRERKNGDCAFGDV